jgi:archaellum component FlaC
MKIILHVSFVFLLFAGGIASAQSNPTFQHPRDQIALQLGAIQMGYNVPFRITSNTTVAQQAANSLVMGRSALDTTSGRPTVQVQGVVSSPAVNTLQFRDQLYQAVEAVVLSPATGTIRGNVTLSNGRRQTVSATLTLPPSSYTIPVPYAVEASTSVDAQILSATVGSLSSNVSTLQTQTSNLSSNLTTFRTQTTSQLGSITGNVTAVQNQAASLSSNLTNLQSQTSAISSNVTSLQSQSTNMSASISSLGSNVTSLQDQNLDLSEQVYALSQSMGWILARDTDGDGVNDYRELKDTTDPNDSNSLNLLSKGLVAYYKFDGNFSDDSGLNGNATPYGNVNFVKDDISGRDVLVITGAGFQNTPYAYLQITRPKGLTSNSTFGFYIKETGYSHWHGANWITIGEPTNSSCIVGHFYMNSSLQQNPYKSGIGFNSTNATLSTNNWSLMNSGEVIIPQPKWVYYTVTISGNSYKLFRDGILAGQQSNSPIVSGGKIYLGIHWWAGGEGFSTRFKGQFASLRVYNRALNNTEVADLYSVESRINFDLGQVVSGGDGLGNQFSENIGKSGIDSTSGNFTIGFNFGHTYYNGYNLVSNSSLIDGVFNLGGNKINSKNVSYDLMQNDASHESFDFITNNREIGGSRSIILGNKTYSSGIGINSGSGITFALNKFREASNAKTLSFSADFGTMSGGNWKVRGYAVFSDSSSVIGSVISPLQTANMPPYKFSSSIPENAEFLTLMVGTGGDSIIDDHAGFGDAKIIATPFPQQ